MRVFARKGYHTSRVGDIAEEAGVAHGLLYHYFDSKEELLETIFRNTWTLMLETIKGVEGLDDSARETLRKVAAIVLRAWRDTPDIVRVLVREVTRSPHLQQEIDETEQAFAALERVIRKGQEPGSSVREWILASQASSSTARSRRSSPAGLWASCRTPRRTSASPSGRSSRCSATASSPLCPRRRPLSAD